jgi:hypothetical protein
MTRHHREKRRKKGGLLMGMRQGVKNVAGVSAKEPTETSRTKKIAGNVLTVVLVLATAGLLLQRCGVIQF